MVTNMFTNYRISINDISNTSYQSNSYNAIFEDKAILTHYLHNYRNGVAKHYKNDAFKVINNLIESWEEINQKVEIDTLIKSLLLEVENVPFPTPNNYTFKFIDLFAGIGGFRIAMQNAGGKCVFTSEWNKDAQNTYQKNFGEVPFGDITKEVVKEYIPNDFDVLCAGFPCQAFSIAGYRKGFSDTRGTLFFDIEQIIEKHKPKVVFLENVKNLISHDKGKTFQIITEILEKKLNYKVYFKVLNSKTHGNVAQNRERIFIVAFNTEKVKNHNNFVFPEEIKLTKKIKDFIVKGKQDEKYYYSKKHKYYPKLEKIVTKANTIYQWRRVYIRENKRNVCPTLTANMGTGGHNVPIINDGYGIRKLTPQECLAFQAYPVDRYILPNIANSKLYMQAGNSVTVSLVERISKEIIKVL